MKKLIFSVPIFLSLAGSAMANDVTVLQAFNNGDQVSASPQNGNKVINFAACTGSDCAPQVAKIEAAPLATTFNYNSNFANCEVIEIHTLTLVSAYNSPTFTGIGFSYNDTSCGVSAATQKGVFVSKAALVQVGQPVTTIDGQAALVHRFVAQGYCSSGTSSNGLAAYGDQFMPYAQYNNGNQDWDTTGEFQLGCSEQNPSTNSLNRTSVLLRQ